MKLKPENLREVIMFGRVLSAGLVVAGYAFLESGYQTGLCLMAGPYSQH